MQHDVVGLKCPACQCSISLQLAWQQDTEQQQQQRLQQLVEYQNVVFLKILDQGQEAERQGELAKAFRLYKAGSAGGIQTLKQWPASNPIVPMIEHCRSRVLWALGRSEKISRALASLEQPLPQPPQDAQLPQPLQMQLQQPLGSGSSSPHNTPGVALGTTHREQLAVLQPLQAAPPQRMHPQVQQQKQVAQQQEQQQQQVAQQQAQRQQQQPVAQEQQQQCRHPVVCDLVSLAWQQKQQQQQ